MRAHTPGTKNHRLWQLDPTHTHRSEGHDPLMDARMQLARLVEKRLDICCGLVQALGYCAAWRSTVWQLRRGAASRITGATAERRRRSNAHDPSLLLL
jgi:predicted methyltransferase